MAVAVVIGLLNILPMNAYSKEKVMSKSYSVWELIDRIGSVQPLKANQVESLLSAKAAVDSENEFFQFWSGTAELPLANNQKISKITFRTNKPVKPDSLSLSIYLDGGCITKKDIQVHYPQLEILDYPRGRSLNEETIWGAKAPWGKVNFGFAERNRDCLVRLGFEFGQSPQG